MNEVHGRHGSDFARREAVEAVIESRHYVRWKAVLVTLLTIFFAAAGSYLLLFHHARYAFAALGTMAVCLGIAAAPQLGFWLYYMLAFTRPQDVFWGFAELRISLAVAGVALLSWILITATHKRPWIRPYPTVNLMLGLALLVFASGMANGGEYDRMVEFVKLLLMAVAFISHVDRRRWLQVLLWLMVFSFGFLSSWGLWQHFIVGYPEIHGPGVNGDGYLYDRNDYAMFIIMGIPFYTAGMRLTRNVFLKVLLVVMVPATMYAVFLTSSRGGLLGVFAVGMAMAWFSRYRVRASVVGGVALTLFYLFLAPSALKDRANTIADYEGDRSAEGRIESWAAGTAMMMGNPLLGVGPNQYVTTYSQYASTEARQAHNSFIQMGAEYGVSGVVLLVALLFFAARDLLRMRRRLPEEEEFHVWAGALLASLAGYVVCGFFLSMEAFEVLYVEFAIIVVMQVVLRSEALAAREEDEDDEESLEPWQLGMQDEVDVDEEDEEVDDEEFEDEDEEYAYD